jgi:O-antigen ligase
VQSCRAAQLLTFSRGLALLWTASIPLSIAVAEAAMWLAAATWGAAWLIGELGAGELDGEPRARGPAGDALGLIGAPIIAFFAISLLSALLSRNPIESLLELKEVFLFAAPLVTWACFRDASWRDLSRAALAAGLLLALAVGIFQMLTSGAPPDGQPLRPSGTLGHYMTYSGVLLVAVPLLLTIRGGSRTLASHMLAVVAVGMIGASMTRSAWIGCAVSLLVFFASAAIGARRAPATRPRLRPALYGMSLAIGVIVAIVLLAAVAGPDALYARAASIFSLEEPTNLDRLAMAAVGLKMIAAYPLQGIGPGLMEGVYQAWVVDWAVRSTNPHLHNNVLQIAAERGLPALAAWLWMMGAFLVVAWRVLRAAGPHHEAGIEARAALAALCGFLAMGMFEYNFSDSEVLMALLYVVSLPLAASAGMGGDPRTAP